MKYLFSQRLMSLIFILLTITSFAQEVISVSKGSAIYEFNPTSITSTPSEGQIIFNFASLRTRTTNVSLGTARAVTRRVLYGAGTITDSSSGYSKVLSSVIEDTFYLSKGSLYWLAKDSTPVYKVSVQDTCYSIPNSVNFQYANGGQEVMNLH